MFPVHNVEVIVIVKENIFKGVRGGPQLLNTHSCQIWKHRSEEPQKQFGVENKRYTHRLYGNLVALLLFADQIILSPFHNSQLQVTQGTWIMQISSYFTE